MAAPKSPYAASLALHAGAALIVFSVASIPPPEPPIRKREVTRIDLRDYKFILRSPLLPAGGGGGGGRSPLPVGVGRLPKPAPRQYTLPMITENREAPLLVEPTLLSVSDPSLLTENFPHWGDPLSKSFAYSNGPGERGGMGEGERGGIGSNKGPYGPGPGSGPSQDGAQANLNISAPKIIYQIEPEFSEEARRAKHQGSVILVVDVDVSGRVSNIRVVKSLGLGLDEKAVEAVSRWRFRPAQKNGKPITVPATIDVNFHLL